MTEFHAYAETPSAGQLGHLSGNLNGSNAASTIVRVVDAAINCGLAQLEGATPGKTCKSPSTAAMAKACIGVLLDPVYLNEIGGATQYLIGQPATLMEEGYCWVNAEGTVALGDPLYVRHTSDGGSNTTPGTFTNVAGGTVVLDTTAAAIEGQYSVELFNGIVKEKFSVDSDGSQTAVEILTALTAAIDASANYSAAGTTETTVTLVAGHRIEVIELSAPTAAALALWTVVDNQKAERFPGGSWASARTGAGLAKIRLNKQL